MSSGEVGEFRTRITNVRWHNQPPQEKRLDNCDVAASHRVGPEGRSYLLDSLDNFDRVWQHMRRASPDAYRMFQGVGCRLLAQSSLVQHRGSIFDRITADDLPGFGCFVLSRSEGDDDTVYPSVCYFHRLKSPPPRVQASSGIIYTCGVLFEDVVVDFCCALRESGDVQLLKQQTTHYQRGYIPTKGFRLPPAVEHIFRKRHDTDSDDIHERAKEWVNVCLSACVFPSGGVQVRCRRGGTTAVFAMTDNDAKAMFPARERVQDNDGRVRRIWHYNKGWTDRNGRTVPGHFKGLRDFEWNGWRIHIRHDASRRSFESGSGLVAEEFDGPTPAGYAEADEVGRSIAQAARSKTTKQINRQLDKCGKGVSR